MGCRTVGCSAEVVQTSWRVLGEGQKAEKVDRLKLGAKGRSLGNSWTGFTKGLLKIWLSEKNSSRTFYFIFHPVCLTFPEDFYAHSGPCGRLLEMGEPTARQDGEAAWEGRGEQASAEQTVERIDF